MSVSFFLFFFFPFTPLSFLAARRFISSLFSFPFSCFLPPPFSPPRCLSLSGPSSSFLAPPNRVLSGSPPKHPLGIYLADTDTSAPIPYRVIPLPSKLVRVVLSSRHRRPVLGFPLPLFPPPPTFLVFRWPLSPPLSFPPSCPSLLPFDFGMFWGCTGRTQNSRSGANSASARASGLRLIPITCALSSCGLARPRKPYFRSSTSLSLPPFHTPPFRLSFPPSSGHLFPRGLIRLVPSPRKPPQYAIMRFCSRTANFGLISGLAPGVSSNIFLILPAPQPRTLPLSERSPTFAHSASAPIACTASLKVTRTACFTASFMRS